MTNIEVSCCLFCPFFDDAMAHYDCMYPSDESPNIEDSKLIDSMGRHWQSNTVHPKCPLKQSPVTIKLTHDPY